MRKIRLPSEIPLEEYPPPSTFIEEALTCVKDADKEGIILRVMGGLAILLHANEHKELFGKLDRLGKMVFTDIDFASYGKFRGKLLDFFKQRGYVVDQTLAWRHGKVRQMYFGGRVPMIDIFFDKLDMCHVIPFKGRLDADPLTLPLSEILLEKLQIVQINEKDLKDSIVLLRAHDLGETDDDMINLKTLSRLLCSDWGFYYTATTNLGKIRDSLQTYNVLTRSDVSLVEERISKILKYLGEQPKSMRWKLRAKIGTRKRWYAEVSDWH